MTENETMVRLGPLPGGASRAAVELVQLGDRRFVLKRSTPARASGERQFQQALAAAGLPSLALETQPSLSEGDLLLELVEDRRTLGSAPSVEAFRLWGQAVAGMHAIRFDTFMRVDSRGVVVTGSWAAFVERLIDRALSAARAADLPPALVDRAEAKLADLRGLAPQAFALTHGDLHANNVLLRGGEAVLFDKAAGVWACPPAFDLALVHTEGFPAVRYGVSRPGAGARHKAFMAAYGNVPDAEWLDHFALAHALRRHPNPFVPDMRQIIEGVLARL